MVEFFSQYKVQIIFLHIISAVIWVGGMIAMRFAAQQSFQMIDDVHVKVQRSAYALKRLFAIVFPFVVILIITAVIMSVGLGFRVAAVDNDGNIINKYAMSLYNIIHVKETIWTVMTLNLIAMILIRNKAQKLINIKDFKNAGAKLKVIGQYMVPINIILGIIAIYLGAYLRNAY